jgi:YegS/Rv2252/BmrU family lipid kinase
MAGDPESGRPRRRAQPKRVRGLGPANLKPVYIVVNPASNGGRTAREWPAIAAKLQQAGLDFETAFTSGPLEATTLARAAVREGRGLVVAAGGDGTISEVAAGFFEGGEPIPGETRLGVLPTGTGGDFRRTFEIPVDIAAAASVLAAGKARRIDAGRVTLTHHSGARQTVPFVNIADAGFGGDVVHRVNTGPKFGAATFTVASLLSLVRYRNAPVTVDADGERRDLVAQQVVIANCQYFGGGMRMAPMADPSDGYLDLILVGDVNLLETVRGLGKIRSGTHLAAGNPKWSHQRARRVEVTSEVPVRVDVDGEQPGFLPAVFEIVPGALNVVVP